MLFLTVIMCLTSVYAEDNQSEDSDIISSASAYELKDKTTGLTGTGVNEFYDNPIEVSVGENVTVEASAPSASNYYLEFSKTSKDFKTSEFIDTYTLNESWRSIYSFTPTSDDVGKVFSFKLRMFKETDHAFLHYKIVEKKSDTKTVLDFKKDNDTILIKPVVLNDTGEINSSGSVEIYINNVLNATVFTNESLTYRGGEDTYSVYAVFSGDGSNLRSVSEVYFFTLGNDKLPVNLTLTLNSTAISANESLSIICNIKNAESEDIGGSVDIYEEGFETPVVGNLSNGIRAIYTPGLTHIEGGVYHLYAVFGGDENYSKTRSLKESYKIKKHINLTLTVEGDDFYNITASTVSEYVDFEVKTTDYLPDKLNIYVGRDLNNMTGQSFTGSYAFNSNKKGLNYVYVEFEGNDDYDYSISNIVEVLVYEECGYNSYVNAVFTPSTGVENEKITITPYITYNNDKVSARLKVYNSSLKTDENLIASLMSGDNVSFEYLIPDYDSDSPSRLQYLYYDLEGYDDSLLNHYNISSHFNFYILNTNSLNIEANNESGKIYIDKNYTVILSVKNLTYYNKYTRVNIAVYIEDVNESIGYFPVSGDFNSDIGEYLLKFGENYTGREYVIYAVFNPSNTSSTYYSGAVSNKITVVIMQNSDISLTPHEADIKEGDDYNISSALEGAVEGNITYFDNGEVCGDYSEVPIGTLFSCRNLSVGKHVISVRYNGFEGYYPVISSVNTTVTVREVKINIENTTYGNTHAQIYSSKKSDYILKINNITYANITSNEGENMTVSLLNLKPGNYTATLTDTNNENISYSTYFSVLKLTPALKVTFNSKNLKITASLNSKTTGKITVKIHTKTYNSLLSKGSAGLTISNLAPGSYNAYVEYTGDDYYTSVKKTVKITIPKISTKITAKSKTFKIKKSKKYTAVLKNNKGKAISKVKLLIKVNGKQYSAKTNSKGKATFNLKKLTKKGTYKAKITFNGNKLYNKSVKTVKIKIN